MSDRGQHRYPKMREQRLAETELIHEIVSTAERIAGARALDGRLVVRTDALWSMLRALERSAYCCSISDVARLLKVSRQTAHQLARKAEVAGQIELVTNAEDRRIVQMLLTLRARSALATARSAEASWVGLVMHGLDARDMATTTRVVREIRHRLLRDERERTI